MAYIAIIFFCSSPAAVSCEIKANPDSFYELDACLFEARAVQRYLRDLGTFAVGSCIEVNLGEPV
jgi:hypothetical protein